MSFFDPYHISEYDGYYSKKGQVIQKRHVERNPALTLKDKERAIKILRSFGYKAVKDDYMPKTSSIYFGSKELTWNDIGSLGEGESFQIKLKNILTFIRDLPIMNQVNASNVEEINIGCVSTGYMFRASASSLLGGVRFILGSGVAQDSTGYYYIHPDVSVNILLSPDNQDGKINISISRSNSTGSFSEYAMAHVPAGALTNNYIEGDKYLFQAIKNNDFSDARFDVNVIEVQAQVNESTDPIININEIYLIYTVYVEVIYKTYID